MGERSEGAEVQRRGDSRPEVGYADSSGDDPALPDDAPHDPAAGAVFMPCVAGSDAARLGVVAARLRVLSSQRASSKPSHPYAAALADAVDELAALAALAADLTKRSLDDRLQTSASVAEGADAPVELARQDTFLVRR
jgi:hypothetical protein